MQQALNNATNNNNGVLDDRPSVKIKKEFYYFFTGCVCWVIGYSPKKIQETVRKMKGQHCGIYIASTKKRL